MALESVCCPYCGHDQVRKHGQNEKGKQRYLCQNPACQRSPFLRDYTHKGCRPGIKEQIIEMALNGSGIRDTARVLQISPSTVIETLKKRIRTGVNPYQAVSYPGKSPYNTSCYGAL